MSTARKIHFENPPEDYSPDRIPANSKHAERLKAEPERFVQQVGDYCAIVDRAEITIVGIGIPVSFESPGYGTGIGFDSHTLNDYFIAKKYIADRSVELLMRTLGVSPDSDIICARTDLAYDGNYQTILGVEVESPEGLPDFLPENTVTLTLPACRYAKIEINEQNREDRKGYPERMHADEYFIGDFRKDTTYVYNKSGVPFYLYDKTGDVMLKYEPLKIPSDDDERFDTIQFRRVLLPEMKIACCISPPDGDFVITKFFNIQNEVYQTGLAQYYRPDLYGFPLDADNESGYTSCFGTRVISFDGLPDCVEKITLPGGLYVHVTQLEFNGDNPSIPYDVAFNHMDKLFFTSNPDIEFDHSRKVIARFRQANCASVFVPIKRKD